jgi:hypothetical protein
VFIPDMDVALQFVEARRRALEVGRAAALEDALPTVPTNGMDSPLVLGLLMLFAPPLAVTLVWSNRRLPRAAQIALTVYGALVTLAFAAVAIAALS